MGGYDEDSSPLTAAGLAATQSANISAREAAKNFAPPSSYDRAMFEDKPAMSAFKRQTFEGGIVRDPATGLELVATQAEAKARWGADWAKHCMETDHIIPAKEAYRQLQDRPFLTNQDRLEITNDPSNFQGLSKRVNASKRDQNNTDFINNPTGKQRLHAGEQKLSSVGRKPNSQYSTPMA